METTATPYLNVAQVADRLTCSTRTILDMTRLGEIPHIRRRGGGSRCLFREDWLEAWDNGAVLETIENPRTGGRVCRPRGASE